jgi:hypothetical protein
MNSNNEKTRKIWFSMPVEEIIPMLSMPGLTPEFIPDVCQYNPQKITTAMFLCASKAIGDISDNVLVISADVPMMQGKEYVECVVVLGGNPEELEKIVDHRLPFERMLGNIEQHKIERFEKMKLGALGEDETQYEKMKKSAFNLMRKKNIRRFSDGELWRVFKHAKEYTAYMAIAKTAIKDGLTIESLYEQDNEHDIER